MSNEDIEYQKALAKYEASYMSDAKWLKLFRAIIHAGIHIEHAHWKFIDSTHAYWKSFPAEKDLTPTRFADGKFQPFEYRWIESVFVPHRFRPIADVGFERHQDTEAMVTALELAGQFNIEETADGITIHAYKRRP